MQEAVGIEQSLGISHAGFSESCKRLQLLQQYKHATYRYILKATSYLSLSLSLWAPCLHTAHLRTQKIRMERGQRQDRGRWGDPDLLSGLPAKGLTLVLAPPSGKGLQSCSRFLILIHSAGNFAGKGGGGAL